MNLRAYLCHPHSDNIDLCLPYHHWVVVLDSPPYELIQLVPVTQAPDPDTLRQYLRVRGHIADLTVDDA